jgi:hypothetical protein
MARRFSTPPARRSSGGLSVGKVWGMGLALALLSFAPLLWAKKPAGAQALDFDKLAKSLAGKLKPAQIDGESLPTTSSELTYSHPRAQRLPGKRGIVQLFLQCDGPRCTPRITHAVDGDAGVEVQGRAELPAIRKDSTQFEFMPLGLLDVDKDGKEELLVRYAMLAPARDGKGTVFSHMLAIVTLPELSLSLLHEIKSGGRAGVDDVCTHRASVLALDGDKRLDLRWVRTCECAEKTGCFEGPAPAEDFLATEDRRFVRKPADAH